MPNEWILNFYTGKEATLITDDSKTYDFKAIDPDELWGIVSASLLKKCKITITPVEKEKQ